MGQIGVLPRAVKMSGQHFEDLNTIHLKFLFGCGVRDKEPHSQVRSKGNTAICLTGGKLVSALKTHEKIKSSFVKKKKICKETPHILLELFHKTLYFIKAIEKLFFVVPATHWKLDK